MKVKDIIIETWIITEAQTAIIRFSVAAFICVFSRNSLSKNATESMAQTVSSDRESNYIHSLRLKHLSIKISGKSCNESDKRLMERREVEPFNMNENFFFLHSSFFYSFKFLQVSFMITFEDQGYGCMGKFNNCVTLN